MDKLFNKFPNIKIRYEYFGFINVHVVEILPFDFFIENTEYIDYESKIENRFEELFDEEILFISSESLIGISKPELTLGYDKNK